MSKQGKRMRKTIRHRKEPGVQLVNQEMTLFNEILSNDTEMCSPVLKAKDELAVVPKSRASHFTKGHC